MIEFVFDGRVSQPGRYTPRQAGRQAIEPVLPRLEPQAKAGEHPARKPARLQNRYWLIDPHLDQTQLLHSDMLPSYGFRLYHALNVVLEGLWKAVRRAEALMSECT
jgi:hypothetical protein